MQLKAVIHCMNFAQICSLVSRRYLPILRASLQILSDLTENVSAFICCVRNDSGSVWSSVKCMMPSVFKDFNSCVVHSSLKCVKQNSYTHFKVSATWTWQILADQTFIIAILFPGGLIKMCTLTPGIRLKPINPNFCHCFRVQYAPDSLWMACHHIRLRAFSISTVQGQKM